jgi:tRNA (guanine-N7-)-methyltransferase
MIEITSPNFIRHQELEAPINWQEVFGNSHRLALEIGCGIGDFIVKTAAQFPQINFIAIDFYNKGCDKTCRRLEKHGVENVRVLRVEAREFISAHIPQGSLAAVYINCPDPWPKKRHRKRRLVNPEFINFIRDHMAGGADFFFATDFEDYGEDVANFMPKMTGFSNMLAPDLSRFDLEGYHRSKYMLKFMAEGKQIHFVHYQKID